MDEGRLGIAGSWFSAALYMCCNDAAISNVMELGGKPELNPFRKEGGSAGCTGGAGGSEGGGGGKLDMSPALNAAPMQLLKDTAGGNGNESSLGRKLGNVDVVVDVGVVDENSVGGTPQSWADRAAN